MSGFVLEACGEARKGSLCCLPGRCLSAVEGVAGGTVCQALPGRPGEGGSLHADAVAAEPGSLHLGSQGSRPGGVLRGKLGLPSTGGGGKDLGLTAR